jgi:outer membrane protein assembly factor BamB
MFHFDRYGDTERLTCYKAADAKVLWQLEFPVEYNDSFGYNNGPRAMPVANENFVAALGAAGRLIVADARTGRLKWQKDTMELYHVEPNFFGVGSTPCIYKNLLIVMVGGGTAGSPSLGINRLNQRRAGDSAIVAFDLESGNEVYRVGSYLASYSAPTIQQIDGQDYGFAFCREGLMIFNPTSGEEIAFHRWRASINESVNAAWPVIHGNEIFISETYEIGSTLLNFDGKQLRTMWSDPKSKRDQSFRAHWATPVLIDGVLYGCSGRNEPDSDLRAVQWSDGKVLWTQRTHARANVISIGDHLISVDEYGLLQLIKPNPQKFEVITQMELLQSKQISGKELVGTPVWAPPAFTDGMLIIRGGPSMVALQLGK